jgi:hypothetical protein
MLSLCDKNLLMRNFILRSTNFYKHLSDEFDDPCCKISVKSLWSEKIKNISSKFFKKIFHLFLFNFSLKVIHQLKSSTSIVSDKTISRFSFNK